MGNAAFGGIGETELYEKGTYLSPGGSYELEVQKILLKNSRRSGLLFLVEFKIISAAGDGASQHAPGSKATWCQKMTDPDIAFPAVKQFFVALMEINMNNPEEKEQFNGDIEEILDETTSWEPEDPDDPEDVHPLHGQRIHVDTYSKVTKKGGDFTVHTWEVAQTSADDEDDK